MNTLLELPIEIGKIVSPIVKIIVSLFLFFITLNMLIRHNQKRNILTKNMTIMLICYTLAPLVTAFDILLNWQNILNENSYLGIGIGLILNGIGNSFWLWFNLEVFLESIPAETRKKNVIVFLIGELTVTTGSMLFRLFSLSIWILFSLAHLGFCLYLFFIIFKTVSQLLPRIEREDPHKIRLLFMLRSGIYGLVSIILFTIDMFSSTVTLYGVFGWIILIGMCYCIYRAYI